MQIRIKLIENNPLHRVPSIFINNDKSQYIFNIIPTLIRHRKHHRINMNKTSFIFFTKNSIQTIGGLANYLLYRFGTQNSNQKLAKNIYLYGNTQLVHYLEKLRFKIGYKAMRFSFSNWSKTKYRFGIKNMQLFNKLKVDPKLSQLFIKIQSYLRHQCRPSDYFNSQKYLKYGKTDLITLECTYFDDGEVMIYPITNKFDGVHFTHFICSFRSKQNIEKPINILILHHTNRYSAKFWLKNDIILNYLNNKNQTELIVHILEDQSILRSVEFANFISKFQPTTKHLWFGHELMTQNIDSLYENQFNIVQQKTWSQIFPTIIKNIYEQRLKYYTANSEKIIQQTLPLLNSYLYKKSYQYIKEVNKPQNYIKNIEKKNVSSYFDQFKKKINQNQTKIRQFQNLQPINDRKSSFKPKVTFLGTNSSMPTNQRNVSGILASMNKHFNILLDCGQETYQQLINHFSPRQLQKQLLKIRVIFITHIHSDHNLGILNLISQRQKLLKYRKQKQKLFLIIPFNVYNWYAEYNTSIQDLSQSCDILFTQIILSESYQTAIEQQITRRKQIKNDNSQRGTCNMYNFQDLYFSQIQTSAKTKQLVNKHLPHQQSILNKFNQFLSKQGYQQFLPVRVIHCPQSFGIIIKNKDFKLSYSGDTRPSQLFKKSAQNSDLMIHEATFNDHERWKAQNAKHSTVSEAVKMQFSFNQEVVIQTVSSQP